MKRALLVVRDKENGAELRKSLAQADLACWLTSYNNGVREAIAEAKPDVLLYEMDEQSPAIPEIIRKIKQGENLPLIALIPEKMLEKTDFQLDADDFIAGPYDVKELALRINRVLRKTAGNEKGEQIKCEGLMIDLATCEVTIDGRLVELTFKEYEVLKLLAGNKGRVYTREALLDKIWGYDYFGGDRTVDVHVRRLRSKIEDANHIYIETVRNIGYRFIKT